MVTCEVISRTAELARVPVSAMISASVPSSFIKVKRLKAIL
jgi:hypothetical protein